LEKCKYQIKTPTAMKVFFRFIKVKFEPAINMVTGS